METIAEYPELARPALARDRLALQVAVAILLNAFLRLPSLAWGPISDDEAIYDSMAHVLNSGGVMYRDAVDHKPPGLAYLYALIERSVGAHGPSMLGIFAIHAFAILLALVTSVGLFLLAREFLSRELVWIPPALYALVSTTKCAYDGLALNGELLMNAPIVFAVLAVVWAGQPSSKSNSKSSSKTTRVFLDLSAGALMGLAGLSKWQALVAGLAFPFFGTSSFLSQLKNRGVFWLAGLAVPLLSVAYYFRSQGVFSDFLQWGGLFNLRYIVEGPPVGWALRRFGIQFLSVILPSGVFYAAAFYGLYVRGRRSARLGWAGSGFLGIAVWALVSIWAVGIGGRFFGHYFLQAELPLCLLAAEPIYKMLERAPKLVSALVTALVVGPSLVFFVFGLMPALTHSLFDAGEPDWSLIGQAVADQSSPEDTLFIWGNAPSLYFYSHRKMGTRFSFCNYLTGLSPGTPSEYDPQLRTSQGVKQAWPLLFKDLAERKPAFILDTAAAGWKSYSKFQIASYPLLESYVKDHYEPVDKSIAGGAVLYRRTDLDPDLRWAK